jgi:lipoprotein-anchoring transpeptidase ErfK/SrfK
MRRLVGISIRSAAVTTLLLTGAIYVAAEARQAVRRRWNESQEQISSKLGSGSGDRVIGRSGDRLAKPTPTSLATFSPKEAQPVTSASDELAAERQASQLPAQTAQESSTPDTHVRKIVISIPDRRLALLQDGEVLKVYPVAVGAEETPSPDGDFTIINHSVNPTYRHEGKEIAPGKNNPLGTRWMGLSLKGYGIHGTNVQSSVGKAASHGCFRMKKKDVEQLYSLVQVGDAVTIRGERDELTASLFNTEKNANPAVAAGKTGTQVASAATSNAAGGQQ